ncbi:hypothetical protein ACFQRK_23665 [Parapedobacter sp. GCM10030251]|uniref:hypothetical protein n=1 Tax=Parapedobacter sp. GCM10030251 TaxID=3273419 RepID=UPI003623A3CB
MLTKFELIKDSQVTNAGFLLFAKNDVFQAAIELGRFSTPTIIKDGLTVRSDLFGEVEEVLGFIRKHINKGDTSSLAIRSVKSVGNTRCRRCEKLSLI